MAPLYLDSGHGLTRLQFELSKLGPVAWNGKSAHLIRDDNVLSVAILPKDNAGALQMIDKSFAVVRCHEADPSQFVVAAKRLVRDFSNKRLPSTRKPFMDCVNPNDR